MPEAIDGVLRFGRCPHPHCTTLSSARGSTMVEPTGMRAARRRERLAFHQAGHAVVATTFGFRYGALSLHADLALESAHTGPLGIDLWKCSFPLNQQERVLQVLTMLW